MATIIGVFTTHMQAKNAIEELRAFGVPDADISYVYADAHGDIHDEKEGAKVGGGAASGAAAGAVLGALAGFAVIEGVLPGLGTLLVAGPLAAALGFSGAAATAVAGAATGLAAGGLIGALANFGVSEEDAELYQGYIRGGDVLVVARGTHPGMRDVFVKAGAKQIGVYNE